MFSTGCSRRRRLKHPVERLDVMIHPACHTTCEKNRHDGALSGMVGHRAQGIGHRASGGARRAARIGHRVTGAEAVIARVRGAAAQAIRL